jgi:hypothetical protein
MDGGQGNSAGRKPDRVDPVPPLQQRVATHLAERLWAEEQSRVDGPEQISRGGRARRRTGSSNYQPWPAVGLLPARHEGSDGRRRVERGNRGVVAAGAARSKGRAGEFPAWFGGRDAVGDLDEGLIEIAEEPMRMAELRHTQKAIGEQVPAA